MRAGTVDGMDIPHHAPDPSPGTLLRARSPEDLAAFVPLALGFAPHRSVVLVGLGRGTMSARVDLPVDPDDVDDLAHVLLRAARRNDVREAVVLVYDDDTTVADEAAWTLHEELTAAGIRVLEVLRVHDDHWFAVLPGAPLAAYRGVPLRLTDHPFTAQGVYDGRVTHASRDALRATLAQDEVAARRTAADLAGAAPMPVGALEALARGHVAARSVFTAAELASVALTVTDAQRRDEAWAWLDRSLAQDAVDLWSDAVRRLPTSHVAGPAAVLAFAAWLAGNGALAWCAVDRCREGQRPHSLGDLVAGLLDSATSPEEWHHLRPQLAPGADPAA